MSNTTDNKPAIKASKVALEGLDRSDAAGVQAAWGEAIHATASALASWCDAYAFNAGGAAKWSAILQALKGTKAPASGTVRYRAVEALSVGLRDATTARARATDSSNKAERSERARLYGEAVAASFLAACERDSQARKDAAKARKAAKDAQPALPEVDLSGKVSDDGAHKMRADAAEAEVVTLETEATDMRHALRALRLERDAAVQAAADAAAALASLVSVARGVVSVALPVASDPEAAAALQALRAALPADVDGALAQAEADAAGALAHLMGDKPQRKRSQAQRGVSSRSAESARRAAAGEAADPATLPLPIGAAEPAALAA